LVDNFDPDRSKKQIIIDREKLNKLVAEKNQNQGLELV
jgi:hypothetical protein